MILQNAKRKINYSSSGSRLKRFNIAEFLRIKRMIGMKRGVERRRGKEVGKETFASTILKKHIVAHIKV